MGSSPTGPSNKNVSAESWDFFIGLVESGTRTGLPVANPGPEAQKLLGIASFGWNRPGHFVLGPRRVPPDSKVINTGCLSVVFFVFASMFE